MYVYVATGQKVPSDITVTADADGFLRTADGQQVTNVVEESGALPHPAPTTGDWEILNLLKGQNLLLRSISADIKKCREVLDTL